MPCATSTRRPSTRSMASASGRFGTGHSRAGCSSTRSWSPIPRSSCRRSPMISGAGTSMRRGPSWSILRSRTALAPRGSSGCCGPAPTTRKSNSYRRPKAAAWIPCRRSWRAATRRRAKFGSQRRTKSKPASVRPRSGATCHITMTNPWQRCLTSSTPAFRRATRRSKPWPALRSSAPAACRRTGGRKPRSRFRPTASSACARRSARWSRFGWPASSSPSWNSRGQNSRAARPSARYSITMTC